MKNILLIGDTVSSCRVALSVMEPMLIKAGYNVTTLYTAVVSSTFGYKNVVVHDTGDYVVKALDSFEKSGFDFDRVYVGYLTNEEQARAVAEYCKLKSRQGKTIFMDPVMGEECHLYYGMGDENRQWFKNIIPYTDYIMPSYTEAAFLVGKDHTQRPDSVGDIEDTVTKLQEMGAKNIAVTSTVLKGDDFTVINGCEYLTCDHIDVKVAGTGDLFAALFIAEILSGRDLKTAARRAMDKTRDLVEKNMHNTDKMRGITISNQ